MYMQTDTQDTITFQCRPNDLNVNVTTHPLTEFLLSMFLGYFLMLIVGAYLHKIHNVSMGIIIFISFFVIAMIFYGIHFYNNKSKMKNITINPLGISILRLNNKIENILWQDIKDISILFSSDKEIINKKYSKEILSVAFSVMTKSEQDFKNYSGFSALDKLYITLNNNEKIPCDVHIKFSNGGYDLIQLLQKYSAEKNIATQQHNLMTTATVDGTKSENRFYLFLFLLSFLILAPFAILMFISLFHLHWNKNSIMDNLQIISTSILIFVLLFFNIKIVWKKLKK